VIEVNFECLQELVVSFQAVEVEDAEVGELSPCLQSWVELEQHQLASLVGLVVWEV
jgi:hypothetical protein